MGNGYLPDDVTQSSVRSVQQVVSLGKLFSMGKQ